MGELKDFVGCAIKRDLTNMTLNIYQPDIINKMNQGFNGDVKSLMTFNTSDTPHQVIVSNQETDEKKSYDIHKRYRSGIGYLLYLRITHNANCLTRYMNSPNVCMKETLFTKRLFYVQSST